MATVSSGMGGDHTGDGRECRGGTGRFPGGYEGVGQEVEVGKGRRVPQPPRRGPLPQSPVQDRDASGPSHRRSAISPWTPLRDCSTW